MKYELHYSKLKKTGQIASYEAARLKELSKEFDRRADLEVASKKLAQKPQLYDKQSVWLQNQMIGIVPAELNQSLTQVEDLAEIKREMDAIKDYKGDKPILRIFGNDNAFVLRVVQQGRVTLETWIQNPEEIEQLKTAIEQQGRDKVIEMLFSKHQDRTGVAEKTRAILAARAGSAPSIDRPTLETSGVTSTPIVRKPVIVAVTTPPVLAVQQTPADDKAEDFVLVGLESPSTTAPEASMFGKKAAVEARKAHVLSAIGADGIASTRYRAIMSLDD